MNNPFFVRDLDRVGDLQCDLQCLIDGQRTFGGRALDKLHDERLIKLTDGEIFNTITHGKNLMGPYADKLDVSDRWAVISYVRALQLSRLAKKEEIPDAIRATLK